MSSEPPMLAELKQLVDEFAERGRRWWGENNDVAIAWAQAAADLAVVLTVPEQRSPGDSPIRQA